MLEDMEIDCSAVDTYSNNFVFFDKNMSLEEFSYKKIEFMKNFVENKGFNFLVKVRTSLNFKLLGIRDSPT